MFDFDILVSGSVLDLVRNNLYIRNVKPIVVKKIFLVIWILGAILILSFRTPVKYYQFYGRFVVLYTHIFSNKGKILAGQLVLYMFIWTAFLFLTYSALAWFKKNK